MKLKTVKVDKSGRNKHLKKKGGKYFFANSTGSEKVLMGVHCKAYQSGGRFFFQFDAGHFMTKFVDVEITEDEFVLLRNGLLAFEDLQRNCVEGNL